MKNLKKYVTLNLLSILGLILFVFSLYVFFYIYPTSNAYEQAGTIIFYIYILLINMLTVFGILTAALIEFLIYKCRKSEPKLIKIPDRLCKIHSFLFKSGLTFSILSFTVAVIYMFLPIS